MPPLSERPKSRPTRHDKLLGLLRRPNGMSAPALCTSFGWQPHSLRAAISRLRKSGVEIETRQTVKGDATLYRLRSASKNSAGNS